MIIDRLPAFETPEFSMPFYAQHIKQGRLHLMKSDATMKQLIKQVGPFTARTKRDRFGTLVHSILSQQISVAAARTIRERLTTALGPQGLTPANLLQFDVDQLRELGVSRQKANYSLDLAEKVDAGTVDLNQIHRHDDESAIAELVQVKGIGRWTAQMFLMFSLGRMDILPVDDLGLKNAVQRFYQLETLPAASDIETLAIPWRPYATIASWYLWQGLDLKD